MTSLSERTIVIANRIELYVAEHPWAADTPKGICEFWLASGEFVGSLTEVHAAVDYLVERRRLRRTVSADGTVICARAGPAD